jgi:hypothetical protein
MSIIRHPNLLCPVSKISQSSSHPEILTPDVLSRQQRLRFNVYTDTIQELDADGSLGNADMYTEEIQKM